MDILATIIDFVKHHLPFIFGVVINLALIWFFCKLIDVFQTKTEQRLLAKNSDSPLLNLLPILNKILKVVVIFILLAGFLQSFGYNVSSLIAGFGITGLAVGFAAKEAIGNVFGSIGLLADRVYKLGDYIKFNTYEGTVININLRSTTIRTTDGYIVNVPNNLLANEEITNVTMAKTRRVDLYIDVEYSTSNEKLDRACEILREIAERDERVIEGYNVFIDNLGSSAIVVRLVADVKITAWAKYSHTKSDIIREIIHRYRAEGIEFAFPSTSVYLNKVE